MKRKITRFFSFLLATILLIGTIPTAHAATLTSDYFSSASALAYSSGNTIIIDFDACATKTMKELGASRIVIFEIQSDSTPKAVCTYTRYDTSGMISTNTVTHGANVSYNGTPGKHYYATVVFFAKDANGTETLNVRTNTI